MLRGGFRFSVSLIRCCIELMILFEICSLIETNDSLTIGNFLLF